MGKAFPLAVAVILFGSSWRVFAASTMTGNELIQQCGAAVSSMDGKLALTLDADLFGQGYCTGLVNAAFMAVKGLCLPEGVTMGQHVRVVYKYLQDHPELLHEQDRVLAAIALFDAYSCPKKR